MKGYRFYADIPGTMYAPEKLPPDGSLNPRITIGGLRMFAANGYHANCVAVLIGREHRMENGRQEAIAATFVGPDSDTSLTAVSRDYLQKCRRIPESLARTLHPRLFARLDAAE